MLFRSEEKMALTEEERIVDDVIAYIRRHHARHDSWPTVRDMKKSAVGKKYGSKPVIDMCEWACKAGLIVKATAKHSTRYALLIE